MYLPGLFRDPYVEDTLEVVWRFASPGQLCRQVRRSKDMAMGLVSGRVAIVSAAQGIGASYAKALAREGAKLCVSDIADCDDTVQQSRAGDAEAIGMRCDVTKSDEVDWSDFVSTNIASRSLKREMLPDDLVGALLLLVGPQSDFMTGQTIVTDRGSVFH